jgi:hypothetical protein
MSEGRGPTIPVLIYITEAGERYYEELAELPVPGQLLAKRVEHAKEIGHRVHELELRQMPREEYEAIPASAESAAFFEASAT